jgi:hypothetical protein
MPESAPAPAPQKFKKSEGIVAVKNPAHPETLSRRRRRLYEKMEAFPPDIKTPPKKTAAGRGKTTTRRKVRGRRSRKA